jgi:hypothetical protein
VRDSDAGVWRISYTNGNNTWYSWLSISDNIPIHTEPDAVSWGAGQINVFAWGANESLRRKAYDGGNWTPRVEFENLKDALNGPPKAISDEEGSLYVFECSNVGT